MRHWEIYALRYAEHERLGRESLLRASDVHDAPLPMDYFVWVLQSEGRTIVVDTGFSPEGARKHARRLVRPVPEALAGIGVDPAAVEDVIITRLHYDHAGNLDLFPKTRLHIQEREIAFATGKFMCQACIRAPFEVEDVVRMVRAVYAERVEFHAGDGQVAEGVTLHHVGGHTDGLQMVRVETARGPVVLASDASYYYLNMASNNPFPIYFNLGAMTMGWRRARLLAGSDERVIPGHDPLVRKLYPRIPGSEGESVMLHLAPRHSREKNQPY